MLPDKRACNVYGDVIHCKVPPPKLNSANIFYARFWAKPLNLKTANMQFRIQCLKCVIVIKQVIEKMFVLPLELSQ